MIGISRSPILLPALFIIISVACFAQSIDDPAIERRSFEDAGARIRWEIEQLRDPASGTIPRCMRAKELMYASTLPSRSRRGFAKSTGGPFQWRSRGPSNVAGRVRAVAVDAGVTNVILAGGVSGGLWRSTDRGANWTKTSALTEIQAVTSIAQDTRPGKRHIWYYGTGEYMGVNQIGYCGDGIFKSIDGGRSWMPLLSMVSKGPGIDGRFDVVTRIAVDPSNLEQRIPMEAATAPRAGRPPSIRAMGRGSISSAPQPASIRPSSSMACRRSGGRKDARR